MRSYCLNAPTIDALGFERSDPPKFVNAAASRIDSGA
jgi:hypothetical protein